MHLIRELLARARQPEVFLGLEGLRRSGPADSAFHPLLHIPHSRRAGDRPQIQRHAFAFT